MNKIALALAFAGAAGLVAACGAAGEKESGSQPAKSESNPVTAPIAAANEVADQAAEAAAETNAGMAAAATQTHELTFSVDGMT